MPVILRRRSLVDNRDETQMSDAADGLGYVIDNVFGIRPGCVVVVIIGVAALLNEMRRARRATSE